MSSVPSRAGLQLSQLFLFFSCLLYSQIGEVSAKFLKCNEDMSACICAICKHFTSVDKKLCYCEKCGICR